MAASRIQQNVLLGVLVLLGVVWLITFSLVDSENRRLEPDEKKLRKKEASVLSLAFFLIYIVLLLFGKGRYAVCVGAGILQTVGLQAPCILQKVTKKVKNMSFYSRRVEK